MSPPKKITLKKNQAAKIPPNRKPFGKLGQNFVELGKSKVGNVGWELGFGNRGGPCSRQRLRYVIVMRRHLVP